ncbi:hypothetical protein [Polyangium jinanense]|uniref:Uncharacterized protein n=1 Tax=Polyangium jinanense TaxID=2829994 RepID=A0A9X4ATP0_9BACT|nr:hypothetical protein [Polyangium jinanense]MDC3960077.1 hypothetical protein [Polyangium jinanense]MDC3984394.1 hypothetical protein [Polyangium jinanense]
MSVLPNAKTPIDKCEHKSLHTRTMLTKFQDVPALDGLAAKLEAATSLLLATQDAYNARVKALIVVRVEVKFTDLLADRAVRLSLKRAEIEDGKPGGKIVSMLFPSGSTPIIKPVGSTQVQEMRALEGRYAEVGGMYPAAVDEAQKITTLRIRYEQALDARRMGMESAAQARAARNLAKEEFLDVFAEVANRIKAAFPRDKATQDLFFLKDKVAADDGDTDDADSGDDTGEA